MRAIDLRSVLAERSPIREAIFLPVQPSIPKSFEYLGYRLRGMGRRRASGGGWGTCPISSRAKGIPPLKRKNILKRKMATNAAILKIIQRGLRGENNRNEGFAICAFAELNNTFSSSEDGVVKANAHASAGVELGAALTHDDVTRNNFLATKDFNAKTLARGIAAVAG